MYGLYRREGCDSGRNERILMKKNVSSAGGIKGEQV